ncbi:obg-like ATPase 1 [Populus alba]|nr:obg-like ATPase 1 [Populus alba]
MATSHYTIMAPDEAAKYCEENKLQSCLQKIIKIGFSAINLIYFFTAGPDEVKCWQIRRQTKAPQAAGTIHTDFERGFICAEVMKFDDLKEFGSESAVKAPFYQQPLSFDYSQNH